MSNAENEVHASGPNIFADLGLADAEQHLLKARIVSELYRIVNEEKLNQTEAGRRMGISQPEVSRLFKGNFREYSLERLVRFLIALNQDVEIIARPSRGSRGEVSFRHEVV